MYNIVTNRLFPCVTLAACVCVYERFLGVRIEFGLCETSLALLSTLHLPMPRVGNNQRTHTHYLATSRFVYLQMVQ